MLLVLVITLSVHQIGCQESYEESIRALIKNGCGSCDIKPGLDVSKIKVYTYNFHTAVNESYYIGDDTAGKILKELSPNQCIDIFVPGFTSTIDDVSVKSALCILSQIKCKRKNTFGIVFDHSFYTNKNITKSEIKYIYAVNYTRSIGEEIGKVIVELLNVINVNDVNIVGHSLGGQMIGYSAEYVKKIREPLPIIYAADPAGPCFQNCSQNHVRSGQADKVVTIHCTKVEGSNLDVADYDIVSNNGKSQPGCAKSDHGCSHKQCLDIAMLPAIQTPWIATRCDSYCKYRKGKCAFRETMEAGYRIYPTRRPGMFYFKTPGAIDKCFF